MQGVNRRLQDGLERFRGQPSPPECGRFRRVELPSVEPDCGPGAKSRLFFSFWFTFFCFFSMALRTAPLPPVSARASYFARNSSSFLSATPRQCMISNCRRMESTALRRTILHVPCPLALLPFLSLLLGNLLESFRFDLFPAVFVHQALSALDSTLQSIDLSFQLLAEISRRIAK